MVCDTDGVNMDIILFAVLLGFALTAIGFDYYRNVSYMGVIGGVMLVLIGMFLAGGTYLTVTTCDNFYDFNATSCSNCCITTNIAGTGIDGWLMEGFAVMMMLVGAGVVSDVIIRAGERKKENEIYAV